MVKIPQIQSLDTLLVLFLQNYVILSFKLEKYGRFNGNLNMLIIVTYFVQTTNYANISLKSAWKIYKRVDAMSLTVRKFSVSRFFFILVVSSSSQYALGPQGNYGSRTLTQPWYSAVLQQYLGWYGDDDNDDIMSSMTQKNTSQQIAVTLQRHRTSLLTIVTQ